MAQPSAHTVAHPPDTARLADHRRCRRYGLAVKLTIGVGVVFLLLRHLLH
jgi:hypothetical protein